MSDDELRKLADALAARVASGKGPVVLQAPESDHEAIRAALLRMGLPEAAIVLRAPVFSPASTPPPEMEPPRVLMTPEERCRLAIAVHEVQRTDPYRRARACHVAADAMLGRYRHNDPAIAARIRAERKKGKA